MPRAKEIFPYVILGTRAIDSSALAYTFQCLLYLLKRSGNYEYVNSLV